LTRVSDRRSSLRFEIVGRLRGSLATAETVRLHDISPGGALVEVPFSLPVDSRHAVQVVTFDHVSALEARVRHVRPAFEIGRFLVGLEFMTPEHLVREALGSVITDREAV
jgi:c-di-GMP-binding flagellar brake protein YcgR